MEKKSAEKPLFPCEKFGRILKSKSGQTIHQKKCEWKNPEIPESRGESEIEHPAKQPFSKSPLEQANLSSVVIEEQTFYWNERKGSDFLRDLDTAYEQVVYCRQNLFLLPTGKAGKKFIGEITKLINCWIDDTALKPIALKSIMVMPALLLQKPSRTSKSKDHFLALSRRIELWEKGNINELLHEGVTIQTLLNSSKKIMSTNEISKRFIEKMSNGNINGAIKLLSDNMQNGILPLNDETLKLLKQKHPDRKAPTNDASLSDTPIQIHSVRFEDIDSDMIRQSALKTRGGAGPSGLDRDGWRRILTSNCFGTEPSDLYASLSKLTKILCSINQEENSLEPLLASRLIPLNKNPGLRPIGIGETLRRIIGKTVARLLKQDVVDSV